MNILQYNRKAWDTAVARGSEWTVPVGEEVIAAARCGEWRIILTPTRPVPRDWFPSDLTGVDVLCLASGGGQQGPVLAAAGATVTVFDNSPAQLAQDRLVAEREGLNLRTVEGDMADLSAFYDATFDPIVHPCSNLFVPDVRPVWRGRAGPCAGGAILAGFMNPAFYIFDQGMATKASSKGAAQTALFDLHSLTPQERQGYMGYAAVGVWAYVGRPDRRADRRRAGNLRLLRGWLGRHGVGGIHAHLHRHAALSVRQFTNS